MTKDLGYISNIIHWIARVLSIVSIGILLLFFIGEGFNPVQLSIRDWILFLFFPLGITIGIILAWRCEMLGGVITFVSLLSFYASHFIMSNKFPAGPYFLIFALPGIIFMLFGMFSYSAERRKKYFRR